MTKAREFAATMKTRRSALFSFGVALAVFGACGPAEAGSGDEGTADAAQAEQAAGDPVSAEDLTVAEVLPLSCAQVWALYGDTEDLVVEIVKAMAGTSVETRGLTFPETNEAGMALGNRILEGCAADRDELLYAIVDRAVRQVVQEMGGEE